MCDSNTVVRAASGGLIYAPRSQSCCWLQTKRKGMPSGPEAASPVEGELVAVIERTRAVAERWKALHLREEGMCAELRQLVRKSARSVDSAREMRDKAVEVQKAAQLDAVAAKHEKARWRARADAQSNAKVFLEADRLRGEWSAWLGLALG